MRELDMDYSHFAYYIPLHKEIILFINEYNVCYAHHRELNNRNIMSKIFWYTGYI